MYAYRNLLLIFYVFFEVRILSRLKQKTRCYLSFRARFTRNETKLGMQIDHLLDLYGQFCKKQFILFFHNLIENVIYIYILITSSFIYRYLSKFIN